MMVKIMRFLPALRIHSWGGLGSQLFTAYLILKIKERFTGRRIKVILHSSGLTYRVPEFDFDKLGVRTVFVDDYKEENPESKSEQTPEFLNNKIRKIITKFGLPMLRRMNLILNLDSKGSFTSVKFFTLTLRGHYTRLDIEKKYVESLYKLISEETYNSIARQFDLTIHYRLGDLLTLSQKSPIHFKRLEKLIDTYKIDSLKTIVLTDSQALDYQDFFQGSEFFSVLSPTNVGAAHALNICIHSKFFIGTGAKLSLWASIFRSVLFNRNSYLPIELIWIKDNKLSITWY